MRRRLMIGFALAGALGASADQVVFRDGSTEQGTVLSEHNDVYTFSSHGRGTYAVPKRQVRFVLYEDSAVAEDRLHLKQARAHCVDPAMGDVEILPTGAYADAVLDAVRHAKKYIYVMTYSLSGSSSGKIAKIYDALRERAAAGVKVYLIVPAGSRAAAGVRISARNAAEALTASGIQVRYLQQTRVQHKKLIVVDTRKAFVGSANLTAAAVSGNVELSLATEHPPFVEQALRDVRSMLRRARTADRLRP